MASPAKVNIAIIGGGLIGPRHAQSVLKSTNCTLIALVDPAPHGPQTAANLKTNYYPSIPALLASPHKPDGAIVCTPNSTHVALSKELASAGIHILVEKPISTDIPSGKDLIAHAKSNGARLLVGHHRRFNPYVVATKKLLSNQALGQVLAVSGLWTTFKPPSYYDPPTEWRRGPAGGVVFINLVHEIDILHHLFGPITRVHAEATSQIRGFAASEGGALIFKFQSGVVATFVVSDATPSPFNFEAGTGENPTIPNVGSDFYRIFGTDGTLSVPDMTRFSYDGAEAKSWTEAITEDVSEVVEVVPFDAQVEHFVRVVRGEEEPLCNGDEALRALAVCEAVMEALKESRAVEVKDLSYI